jgi:nicotinamidase-related amidase
MPKSTNEIRFGSLRDSRCCHLCVDMQRLFAEDTPWHTPWMDRVRPKVLALVERHPSETVFTRFIPARRPGEGHGTWRRYYEHWADVTVERLGAEMVELLPELARFVPPAIVIDKNVYSPWIDTDLNPRLQSAGIDTIVVSGGETDVCVLAAVLGAVDRGYRVVVATDALCSSSDETHDALMTLYHRRYGQQVETAETEVILDSWG